MPLTTSLRPATARPGFTLVEMLMVVTIVTILLALTVVGLQKATDSQKNRTSREQVYKLQQSLDVEYQRVLEACRNDQGAQRIPQQVVAYCDNDANRALAVWTAMKLRQQFPDSFAEAVTPFTGIPGYSLTANQAFASVSGLGSAAATPAPDPNEKAALLYLILATKSVSGGGAMASSADDLGLQMTVTIGNKPFKAFVDAWGRPVFFNRWFGTGVASNPAESDLQTNAEYYGSLNQFNAANKDPLDPRNLVIGWKDASGQTNPKLAQMAAGPPGGLSFTGLNRTPTVYSLGKDPNPTAQDSEHPGPADDIIGFRLRRAGK